MTEIEYERRLATIRKILIALFFIGMGIFGGREGGMSALVIAFFLIMYTESNVESLQREVKQLEEKIAVLKERLAEVDYDFDED